MGITVNELIKQLEILQGLGCGEHQVFFRTNEDFDEEIKGVHDNGADWVALG
jgi:hypothetical protein